MGMRSTLLTLCPPPPLLPPTAYEILELYLELVAVRATMIAQSKTIPGDMMEVRVQWVGGGDVCQHVCFGGGAGLERSST